MQKRGAAAGIANDKERGFDFLLTVCRKNELIDQEKNAVENLCRYIKQKPNEKDRQAFRSKAVVGPFGLEKGFVIAAEKGFKVEKHGSMNYIKAIRSASQAWIWQSFCY
jgi:hypothetical protein